MLAWDFCGNLIKREPFVDPKKCLIDEVNFELAVVEKLHGLSDKQLEIILGGLTEKEIVKRLQDDIFKENKNYDELKEVRVQALQFLQFKIEKLLLELEKIEKQNSLNATVEDFLRKRANVEFLGKEAKAIFYESQMLSSLKFYTNQSFGVSLHMSCLINILLFLLDNVKQRSMKEEKWNFFTSSLFHDKQFVILASLTLLSIPFCFTLLTDFKAMKESSALVENREITETIKQKEGSYLFFQKLEEGLLKDVENGYLKKVKQLENIALSNAFEKLIADCQKDNWQSDEKHIDCLKRQMNFYQQGINFSKLEKLSVSEYGKD